MTETSIIFMYVEDLNGDHPFIPQICDHYDIEPVIIISLVLKCLSNVKLVARYDDVSVQTTPIKHV